MSVRFSTICYIKKDDKYLMLFRNKKEKDINEGKWLGIGGKIESKETPEEGMIREVKEETGLDVKEYKFHGIVSFFLNEDVTEYMFLYSCSRFEGEVIKECDEGELKWVEISKVPSLPLWEGDKIFLDLMVKDSKPFSLKVVYDGDKLVDYKLYYL